MPVKNTILINGSIAYDLLLGYEGSFIEAIDTNKLEQLSVSYFSPHAHRHFGGTAANIAWHLKLLGGNPLITGQVGLDGDDYLVRLEEKGINTGFIETIDSHLTATAIVGTDNAERQIAFFHPGADSAGQWPDLSSEKDRIAYCLTGARDVSMMLKSINWSKENNIPLLFDPGQQVIAFSGDDLKRALKASAGLICNEYEWQVFCQKTGFNQTAVLKETEYLIITLGEQGAKIITLENELIIPVCKAAKVINPTGAGDAFRAGLLTGFSYNWPLLTCGRLGAALASMVVEIEETQLDNLDRDDLKKRYEKAYKEELMI